MQIEMTYLKTFLASNADGAWWNDAAVRNTAHSVPTLSQQGRLQAVFLHAFLACGLSLIYELMDPIFSEIIILSFDNLVRNEVAHINQK